MKKTWMKPELECLSISNTHRGWSPGDGKPPWAGGDDSDDSGKEDELGS